MSPFVENYRDFTIYYEADEGFWWGTMIEVFKTIEEAREDIDRYHEDT